jgi:predicted NBD/HSP70 family sugar kinase
LRSGSNGPRVGSYNRNVVLEAIRVSEGISRVELAERTGLTAQTVSNIVRRLIDEDLVHESGLIQGEMGKPRTGLRVNVAANHAVGVHIDPQAIISVVVDLAGEVVGSSTVRPRANSRPATVVDHVARGVEAAVSDSGVARSSMVGVGIAAPGAIDVESGEVVGPPNLPGWGRVPLRDSIGERLDLPVSLDNDATAAAVGERWVGGERREGSMAFVYLGTGIGCGLILADQVYRGATGNAGELGHVSLDVRGRRCHCGNRGCLEAYVAPWAIAERLGTFAEQTRPPGWSQFAAELKRGDTKVESEIRRAATLTADAAVGLVNLLDVPRIVVGGRDLGPLAGMFASAMEEQVNARTLARHARTVEVTTSLVGESVGAIGAARLVLHRSYGPHLNVLLGRA